MKKKNPLDGLFKINKAGGFKGRHSVQFLKNYERDMREIAKRAENEPVPSFSRIAEYMTETYGEAVSHATIRKHLNLLKKGLPLWD